MTQSLNVVWYRFRATFRGQWSGYLTVIALVALLGGLAMGAVAGARRTQFFYPHYLAGTNPSDLVVGPNVPGASVSNLAQSQPLTEEFGRLPYVKHVVDYTYLLVVPLRKNGTPNPGSALLSAQATPIGSADGEYFSQDRVTVIEGRMADPKAKDEFVTDATLARLTGWHVGQVVSFGAYRFAQASSSGTITGKLLRLNEKLDAGLPEVALPNGLKADLRPYQKTGLQFLVYAARYKLGALLADDMGLGKTVQALAWLEHLREEHGTAPSLVICPASVVFNWRKEAQQFVPGQKVLLLTAGETRHSIRQEIPHHDLVVTNYALLRRDLSALQKFSFRAIILDEAQNIKNPESMVARAAKALRSDHKLALTGTPLENRLLDLWSILEFVHPGYLPERNKFLEQYDRGASQSARSLLSSRLKPVMLRRLKKQVAEDLPDRIEERFDCELTEGQRKFYVSELQRSRQALSQLDLQSGQSRMHVLAALTRLRQICCHPSLAGGKKGLGSGKTTALMEILEPLYAGGHKVLVFSQFVEMLKILKAELEERGRPHFMLTGQTTQRAEVVGAFHACKEPAVFLLSLKAAGTGLNLTSASYVVLYDPWWNPAVEAQAIDRTHRIGQDRTVIAYRLVTRGTVEEKIWKLQQSKARMAQDVLGEEGFTGSLSKQDFEYLLDDDASSDWEALTD